MQTTDYWQNRWKNNETGWHEPLPHPLLAEYYPQLALEQGDTVFVPFCGASVDMAFLARCGYRVIGVEISPKACAQFFTEQGLPYTQHPLPPFDCYQGEHILIYCGDYFALTAALLGEAKAVYDRAAFVAISPTERYAYLNQLCHLMPPAFSVLLVTLYYHNAHQGPPYNCLPNLTQKVLASAFDVSLLKEVGDTPVCQHLQGRGFMQLREQLYYLTAKSSHA